MGVLISEMLKGDFTIQIFLASCAFILPLNKRPNHKTWILLGFIVSVVIRSAIYAVSIIAIARIIGLMCSLLLCVFMFWKCAEVSPWEAVLGVTCAYAAQHLSYAISSVITAVLHMPDLLEIILVNALFVGVLILCYFTVARHIVNNGKYITSNKETAISMIFLLIFAFPLSAELSTMLARYGNDVIPLYIIGRLYGIVCCCFVLWVETKMFEKQFVEAELLTEQRLRASQEEQYLLSKENIELINRKCHDLKHQIAALRQVSNDEMRSQYIDEMQQAVMIYDAVIKTGNAALDTILTERSLTCEKEKIAWTCMADGKILSFMDPVDLYTLFGNALDNALESVRQIDDPDKRQISVRVTQKDQMALLGVTNYYEHTIKMKDGTIQTNKPDKQNHGYGIKSISAIAEKYGGSVFIDTENKVFSLSILIPIS